jgi:hypothetical protein
MRSTVHALNRSDAESGIQKNHGELSIREPPVRRKGRADVVKKFDDRREGAKGDSEMSRQHSTTISQSMPAALRPAALRAGLVLAVLAAMAAFTVRIETAQTPTPATLSASTSDLR